jgi:hypothetical protein
MYELRHAASIMHTKEACLLAGWVTWPVWLQFQASNWIDEDGAEIEGVWYVPRGSGGRRGRRFLPR